MKAKSNPSLRAAAGGFTPDTDVFVVKAAPVPATPCFLPKEALDAMLERGVVGTVASVIN